MKISFGPCRPEVQELFVAAIQGCADEKVAAQAYADFLTVATMLAATLDIPPGSVSDHVPTAYRLAAQTVEDMAAQVREARAASEARDVT